MANRTTLGRHSRLLAAALLAAACSDSVSPPPGRRAPAPQLDVAAAGAALDQANGWLGQSGTALGAGFSPTNPHLGDAIVATFFWRGSTNIIASVTDRLADGRPVGNTYTLVEYVTAGGISMATYVATNVQNFPDPNADWSDLLEVRAQLSTAVTAGGAVVSAFTGVNVGSAQAVGAHRSAVGSGSSQTTAGPGAIPVNAGALVYGVTMSNDGVAGLIRPTGFTTITMMGDATMGTEGDYAVQASGGSVDPKWTWFFDSPNAPRTWLASVIALNPPGGGAQPDQPPPVATRLAFTDQPSSTAPGTTIAPAVKVAALDDGGTTVSSYQGSITVRTNPGPGALSGTTTVTAVNGIATFSDLSIDQAAYAYLLHATAAGLTGATSTAFDIAQAEASPAQADGIALDQFNGTMDAQIDPTKIIKGFNPTNPHVGDAIIATFFWVGTTNIIESVTDHLTQPGFPPVGNTYTLVEYVTAGGVSMATYIATNVQNFPDPNTRPEDVLAVQANLSQPVTSSGVQLAAFTGVNLDFGAALGEHKSATGAGSSPTIAHPGAITLNANALAYGVSMTNVPVSVGPPPDFTHIAAMSNGVTMSSDAAFTVRTSATSVDPQWTWFFDALHPGTWLASIVELNPAVVEPPPPGTLRVTTSTTGSSLDPDGYTVAVNGQSQAIATNNSTGITFTLAAGSYSVALSGVAANCTVTSANPQPVTVPSGGTVTAAFTVSCTAPQAQVRVSGGGRIDPSIGKTTFGFNVDGRSGPPFQGNMQVVYHGGTSQMTRIHSLVVDGVTSSPDPRGGVCITWTGSARINNSEQRRFSATACDNGQPGSSPGKGPDRFGITVDGGISSGLTDLTGGNTQARQ